MMAQCWAMTFGSSLPQKTSALSKDSSPTFKHKVAVNFKALAYWMKAISGLPSEIIADMQVWYKVGVPSNVKKRTRGNVTKYTTS